MNSRAESTGCVIALAVVVALAGCSGGANPDAGVDSDGQNNGCTSNQYFPELQICDDGGTCVPDPEANHVTGTFSLYMDTSSGECDVTGRLEGKGFFMNLGGSVQFLSQQGRVQMELYGIITNNLANSLVFLLPSDIPLDQEVRFVNAGGVATGTYDLVNLDNDGQETGRETVADVVDGYLMFSDFSLSPGRLVSGSLDIRLLKR